MATSLKVLYDFTAETDQELNCAAGDTLIPIEKTADGLWWMAKDKKGNQGIVPCTYVEEKKVAIPVAPVKAPNNIPPLKFPGETKKTNNILVPTVNKVPTSKSGPEPVDMSTKIYSTRYDADDIVKKNATNLSSTETNTKLAEIEESGEKIVPSKGPAIKKRQLSMKGPGARQIAFTLWGHYLGCMAGWFLILMGPISNAWATSSQTVTVAAYGSTIVGLYSVILGVVVLVAETLNTLIVTPSDFQIRWKVHPRGVMYVMLSGFAFASIPTAMPALNLLISGIAYITSAVKQEQQLTDIGHTFSFVDRFAQKERNEDKETMDIKDKSIMRDGLCQWLTYKKDSIVQEGRVGSFFFMFFYIVINVVVGSYFYITFNTPTFTQIAGTPWIPVAKSAGGLLDLNSFIILLPVIKTLNSYLNTLQVGAKSSWIKYIPLRHNLVFHKLVAKVIMIASVVHIVAHFINFASKPSIIQTFGIAPWITGTFITMAMVFIYTAAPEKVRRADYQLFWWNHHFFIVYFINLMFHGLSTLVFLKFGAWLVVLYLIERIFRCTTSAKPVVVIRIKYVEPVIEIRFRPENKQDFHFIEGQYIYLSCPFLSESQSHPFTISSAYEDLEQKDFMSVHIRTMSKGGWTDRLRRYFDDMNPTGKYPFDLLSLDASGKQIIGKKNGIDGKPFLLMDGPHSAPCQHYCDYKASLVVGAGIGLTPVSSIMRATLYYKWKKGFIPNSLYFAWVVRHDEIMSFQWFLSLLTKMNDRVAEDRANGSLKGTNYLEVHIFVTGYKNETGAKIVPDCKEEGIQKLASSMMNPTVKSNMLAATTSKPEIATNKMNDIWIWNGRPDWDQLFAQIKNNHRGVDRDIGVSFCGAPLIGKDLGKMCGKYSSITDKIYFHLHKENF